MYLYQDVDKFRKNTSKNIDEATVKRETRENIGSFAAYIGKYNECNFDYPGEVAVEIEVNTTHIMGITFSCEYINNKYAVLDSLPSVEYMVKHWNSSITRYEIRYKKTWRTYMTGAETKICSHLRKVVTIIRKRL